MSISSRMLFGGREARLLKAPENLVSNLKQQARKKIPQPCLGGVVVFLFDGDLAT